MPLTGQAKAKYQRKYMKGYMRRLRAGLNGDVTCRGISVKTLPDTVKTSVKTQSDNPMAVGYVPPGRKV